jgi:cysteinyl-tRNA synthetase
MSKSLGNFVTVRDALKTCEPRVLRFFLISAHYRSLVDFNNEALKVAETNLEKLLNALERFEDLREKKVRGSEEKELLSYVKNAKGRFEEAMDNDFNTPLAISTLFDLAKSLFGYLENSGEIEAKAKEEVLGTFRELMGVLGIETTRAEPSIGQAKLVDGLVQLVVDLRKELKDRREWEAADKVRRRLEDVGIELEDTPEGTRWRKKRKTSINTITKSSIRYPFLCKVFFFE